MSYKFKVCSRCDVRKKISSFDSQILKGKKYYKPYCSGCKSAAYRKKRPDVIKRIVDRGKKKYRENQLRLKAEVMKHIGQESCLHCGYSDIRALAFHHRNPKEKSFGIANGFTHSMALESLKKEAEKCDVLCMNCHVIEHRSSI